MPPKKKPDPFPPDTCGSCKYAHATKDQLECFASPPSVFSDDGESMVYVRSVMVDQNDPCCHLYKQRMNA